MPRPRSREVDKEGCRISEMARRVRSRRGVRDERGKKKTKRARCKMRSVGKKRETKKAGL